MSFYWIHKNDWAGQEILDEAQVNTRTSFIKVTEPFNAVVYLEEKEPILSTPALSHN